MFKNASNFSLEMLQCLKCSASEHLKEHHLLVFFKKNNCINRYWGSTKLTDFFKAVSNNFFFIPLVHHLYEVDLLPTSPAFYVNE